MSYRREEGLYSGTAHTLDDDIHVISAITAWRKENDTRANYLSARRLLMRLKRERKHGSSSSGKD